MKYILKCLDESRKNPLVFSRMYDSEESAYLNAKRDFRLKAKQLGVKTTLPNLKLWDMIGDVKSMDSGMIYIYSIEKINLVT